MKSTEEAQTGRWDALVAELRMLRSSVGDPSYAEIARRIAARRRAEGQNEHAAGIARSTVYNAFAFGRSRINVPLLREIVQALGASDTVVDEWLTPKRALEEPPSPKPGVTLVLTLMAGCVVLNLVGRELVDFLHLPIYFDMVGTAIAAIALGPWRGAAVGLVTNVAGVIGSGGASLAFVIVNVLGALVWGYGVHRFGMGRTLPRFFALNVLVAAACSLVAVPILVLVYGGTVGQGQDTITQTFVELGQTLHVAVGFSNLMTSVADKLLSGFSALVVIAALPLALRAGADVPPASRTL